MNRLLPYLFLLHVHAGFWNRIIPNQILPTNLVPLSYSDYCPKNESSGKRTMPEILEAPWLKGKFSAEQDDEDRMSDSFRLLTYDTYGLCPVSGGVNITERMFDIVTKLLNRRPKVDAIALQEVFTKDAYNELIKLTGTGYDCAWAPATNRSWGSYIADGPGLMLCTRWRIQSASFQPLCSLAGFDHLCYGEPGVLAVRVIAKTSEGDKKLTLVTTQLQGDINMQALRAQQTTKTRKDSQFDQDETNLGRMENLQEISDFIESEKHNESEATIVLMGNLNTVGVHHKIRKRFKAVDPYEDAGSSKTTDEYDHMMKVLGYPTDLYTSTFHKTNLKDATFYDASGTTMLPPTKVDYLMMYSHPPPNGWVVKETELLRKDFGPHPEVGGNHPGHILSYHTPLLGRIEMVSEDDAVLRHLS